MKSLIHLKSQILKSEISMSSSRENFWKKSMTLGPMRTFDQKPKKVFSQTIPLHQKAKQLGNSDVRSQERYSENGQTEGGEVFHSTFTLWVQTIMKLSKLMSLFP